MNNAMLLMNAGKKVRGWDIHVANMGSDTYGYSNGSGFMGFSGGSFQSLSSDTPTLNYLYTMSNTMFGTITLGNPTGLSVKREDSGKTITMAGQAPGISASFFTASDVGKTIRVVIVE